MVNASYLTKGPKETKRLGERLAHKVLEEPSAKAIVLSLVGNLGGGKTTFLQGFAQGLRVKENVLSPTFTIMKKYKINKRGSRKNFYHFDCYRVKGKEILNLGFKDILTQPQNIIAIEWADKIKKIIPRGSLILKFDFIDEKTRKISINLK